MESKNKTNLGYKGVVDVTVGAGLKVWSPVFVERSTEILLTSLRILDDHSGKLFKSRFSVIVPEPGAHDGGTDQLVLVSGHQSLEGMPHNAEGEGSLRQLTRRGKVQKYVLNIL